MELKISLKQTEVTLELAQNTQTIDSETFPYYHDLDKVLIKGIDKLTKRNSIDIVAIKDYKIVEALGENSTSVKIAQTVVEALKS
jgi:hypothetical protein